MSRAPIQSVVDHLRGLVVAPDVAGLPDGALLERFLARRDEAAFEALVRRHGPMVLGVCRRLLPSPQDAEDAFQATFLVFVRKAAGIARRELLGNWLYGVAYQTARSARTAAGRRRAKEAQAMPRQPSPEADVWRDLQPVLDQELSGLPDKYRLPLVLCHLEGKCRRDAARALGLPEGTLSSRLARARAVLARRLARRGLALSAGALAALTPEVTAAALPPALIVNTVEAGVRALAGPLAAGAVSPAAVALSEQVVKAMFLSKLTMALAALVVAGTLALGVGTVAARQLLAAGPAPEEQASTPRGATAPREEGAARTLRQALDTAQTITDAHEKFAALLRIAAVQNQTGNAAGARKTCRAALEIARGFDNDPAKVNALGPSLAMIQSEAGDRDGAAEALKLAREAADAIEDHNRRGNALMRLASAYSFVGDYEGALRTAEASGAHQAAALQSFARFLRNPDKPAARKALRKAVATVQSLPEHEQRQFLPALASAQVRVGDLEGARKAIEPLGPWKVFGQEEIGVAQAQTGDVAGALETAKAFQADAPRARVLAAVARAQAKAGQRAAAEETLKAVRKIVADLAAAEAKRAARPGRPGLGGSSRAAHLEAQVAVTQFHLGDLAGARKTAGAIKSEFEKARAWLDLGAAAAAAGKREEAREFLRAAARAIEGVKPGAGPGDWPPERARNSTLRLIAREQAKVGDVREALRTAEAIGGDLEREIALESIVPAQAEAGDVKGALQTLARIKESSWQQHALAGLVQARVKAGDERGAQALVSEQKSPALKVHALLGLAKGQAGKK
jgi:RNA polymerase sigma factor (sigma-70 family)